MSFHSDQTAIHVIQNYTFADATERLAATGFVPEDIGKVARQEDLETYFILTNDSPITWVDFAPSGGNALADGDIPAADGAGGLKFGGAIFDGSTGEQEFDHKGTFPADGVNVGAAARITGAGSGIAHVNLLTTDMKFPAHAHFDTATGAERPHFLDYGAEFTETIQPVSDTLLTANPLVFFHTPVISPSDNHRLTTSIEISTGGPMTNFVVKITDQTSGIDVRFIPSKAAFEGREAGLTLTETPTITFHLDGEGTDDLTNFFFGYVPFETLNGKTIRIEMKADTMAINGDSSGDPFLAAQANDGPVSFLQVAPTVLTEGSVPFADAAGELIDDNASLFWDAADKRLKIDNLTVSVDALFEGTSTFIDTENLSVTDSFISLNAGHTAIVPKEGGLVVNTLPTATADTVTAGAFVAGIASTSNPTVITDGSATFSSGDIIQVSGTFTKENDGIFEVDTHISTTLTVRGIGVVSTDQEFSRNQFTANASDDAVITKVTVSVIQASIDGEWKTAVGATTDSLIFKDLLITPAELTEGFMLVGVDHNEITEATPDGISGIRYIAADGFVTNRAASGLTVGFEVENSSGDAKAIFAFDDNNATVLVSFDSPTNLIVAISGDLILQSDAAEVKINSGASDYTLGDGAGANLPTLDDASADAFLSVNSADGTLGRFSQSFIDDKIDAHAFDPLLFVDGSTQDTGATRDGIGFHPSALNRVNSFDFSPEDINPLSIYVRKDGLKMFMGGNDTDLVFEYNMTTPWDLSTASYSGNQSNFTSQAPRGLFFKPDGTRVFILRFTSQMDSRALTTPWDITTMGSNTFFSVPGTNAPDAMWWNPDGLSFYVRDSTAIIRRFDLTTAWDLATAFDPSITFDTTPEGALANGGVSFRPDGASMYVVDTATNVLLEYGLPTPWDITTAVLTDSGPTGLTSASELIFDPTGTTLFILVTGDDLAFGFDVGVSVDGRSKFSLADADAFRFLDGSEQTAAATENNSAGHFELNKLDGSLDVDPQLGAPLLALFVSEDGMRLFVAGNEPTIHRYEMTAPWDITTASNSGNQGTFLQSVTGIFVSPDGTRLITLASDGSVRTWELTTPFDLSTNIQLSGINLPEGSSVISMWCSKDGRRFYTDDSTDQLIRQYDFGRPYDASTLVFTGNQFATGTTSGTQSMWMRDDGRRLYFRFQANLREYFLPVPWDVSDTVLRSTIGVDGGDNAIREICIKNDGSVMFAGSTDGSTFDRVDQYDLGVVFNALTVNGDAAIGGDLGLTGNLDVAGIGTFATEINMIPPVGDQVTLTLADSGSAAKLQLVYNDFLDVVGISTFSQLLMTFSNPTTINMSGGDPLILTGDFEVSGSVAAESVLPVTVEFADGSLQARAAIPGDQDLRVNTLQLNFQDDISAEINNLRGIWMSADGLKFYAADNTTQTAFEYDLATPFDMSTAVFSGNSLLFASNMTAFFLRPDGTTAYFMTFGGDFTSFPLSTPFDLSTAGSGTIFNTTVASTSAVSIMPNGLDVYFLQDNANNGNVLQWEMTTPWDFSTLADTGLSFVSGQADSMGFWVADDNRTFFVTNRDPDEIKQFEMAVPGDISTSYLIGVEPVDVLFPSEIFVSSDAKNAYIAASGGTIIIEQYDLGLGSAGLSKFGSLATIDGMDVAGTLSVGAVQFLDGSMSGEGALPSDIAGHLSTLSGFQTFDINAQDTDAQGISIGDGGRQLYMLGNTGNDLNIYDLSTPYDISTAVFDQAVQPAGLDSDPRGLFFKPDGLSLYVCGNTAQSLVEFALSTAWDATTATLGTTVFLSALIGSIVPEGVYFRPDGKRFFIFDANTGLIDEFECAVAWDLSSVTLTGNSLNVSAGHYGLSFGDTGQLMFLVESNPPGLKRYSMAIPWDITTATLIETLSLSLDLTNLNDIYMRPDLAKFYLSDAVDNVIAQYELGIEVDGIMRAGGQQVSRKPPAVLEVFTASDLDAIAVGGVITVDDILTIDVKASVTSDVRYVVNGGQLNFSSNQDGAIFYQYSGTGTLFTGNGDVRNFFVDFVSSSTGTFMDFSGDINWAHTDIASWDNLGILRDGLFLMRNAALANNGVGFKIINANGNASNMTIFNTPVGGGGAGITVENNVQARLMIIADMIGFNDPTGSMVSIDPGLHEDSTVTVSGLSVQTGGLFDKTGGTTGTFTAVADASEPAEAITSVSDIAGVARFNFSAPPTLFVGQEVVISAFVTNTSYNGTHFITATGAGFFEIATIAFGTSETGSFLSNSVTLTDTTTTLVDGDTLVIDTDFSTDYDGGATVFNQLTNSFQISRTFTTTHTGSWDTSGLDQKDPRVLAQFNPGFPDSAFIATAFVNNNATANGAIVNNTFTDMVFGTGGSALVSGSTIERWKLIDEVNGTFEYTGNEPFDGLITFDFTVVSSGGSVDFRFEWEIDTGSGFGDLPDPVQALINVGSNAASITKTFPLAANKGDMIKPQITRNSGTSGITTSFATIYATQ